MYCTKCGAAVNDGAAFCPACGIPVPANGTPVAANQAQRTPASWIMAIISMVLGIVGLFFSFIPCVGLFSILFTIPGIVLGTIALVKAVKNNTAGRGFAIVGLICSILGSVIFVVQCIVVNATADLLSKGPSSFLNDDDDDLKALKKSFKELDEAFKGLDTSDSDLDSSWGASSKGKKEKSFFDSALEAAQKKLERQLERELENANRELERENMELERELRDLN